MPVIFAFCTECEGRLKCTVYGRSFCCVEWKLRISDRVLLKRVYNVVSVFPTYCLLHCVHVIRYIIQLDLQVMCE